jgi:hypothetical protein
MRSYGAHWLKASVAQKLLATVHFKEFDGTMTPANAAYMESQKALHEPTGSLLIFTRDTGHHTSGWFKNPEFERCLHLSISFREPFNVYEQAEFNRRLAGEWCELFFGDSARLAWIESPKSAIGRKLEVLHYRVFCDEYWQPINPRGEVYSTELTEKGWKSWGELHPAEPEPSTLNAG